MAGGQINIQGYTNYVRSRDKAVSSESLKKQQEAESKTKATSTTDEEEDIKEIYIGEGTDTASQKPNYGGMAMQQAFGGKVNGARDPIANLKKIKEMYAALGEAKDSIQAFYTNAYLGARGQVYKPQVSGEAAKFSLSNKPEMIDQIDMPDTDVAAISNMALAMVSDLAQSMAPGANNIAAPSTGANILATGAATLQDVFNRNQKLNVEIAKKNSDIWSKWHEKTSDILKEYDKNFNEAEREYMKEVNGLVKDKMKNYVQLLEERNKTAIAHDKALVSYSDQRLRLDIARMEKDTKLIDIRSRTATSVMKYNAKMQELNRTAMTGMTNDQWGEGLIAMTAQEGIDGFYANTSLNSIMDITPEEFRSLQGRAAVVAGEMKATWDDVKTDWLDLNSEEKNRLFGFMTSMASKGYTFNSTLLKPILNEIAEGGVEKAYNWETNSLMLKNLSNEDFGRLADGIQYGKPTQALKSRKVLGKLFHVYSRLNDEEVRLAARNIPLDPKLKQQKNAIGQRLFEAGLIKKDYNENKNTARIAGMLFSQSVMSDSMSELKKYKGE